MFDRFIEFENGLILPTDRRILKEYKTYVAGPYTGKTFDDVRKNILIARRYVRALMEFGVSVICPHLNTAFLDYEKYDLYKPTWEDEMAMYMNILKSCELIYMLPNWELSNGASREYLYAFNNNIPQLAINFSDFGIDVERVCLIDCVKVK